MKFSRVIGKIDPKILAEAEHKLTVAFLEFGTGTSNVQFGTNLGGDPFIFTLMVPVEHVATLNIKTAATDGRKFFWNPIWLAKKNALGVRFTCFHESTHSTWGHPQRRGNRDPRLWNWCIDYLANGHVMDDLLFRLKDKAKVHEAFVSGLGNYLTLEQCIARIKNPFDPIPGMEHWVPDEDEHEESQSKFVLGPEDDRELTFKEKKDLEDSQTKKFTFYFADPNLEDDMKKPEKIYDLLYALLPKCSKCGQIGKYKYPNQKGAGKGKGDSDVCCSGMYDILGDGDLVDDHIDITASPQEIAKKLSNAIQSAKQMAGRTPAGMEDELGILTAPKIRWQDFIRTKLNKVRMGNSKNDWSKFRTRPMFAGLMIPKRTNCVANFGCLLDTSGSMTKEDMAFGISQLSSLDDRSEGIIIPADAQIYWDKATKIRSSKSHELAQVKIIGRGGTKYAEFFTDFRSKIGKQDFLIVVTDGFLLAEDVKEMVDPGVDVIWLITSGSAFKAPFGRVFDLKSI